MYDLIMEQHEDSTISRIERLMRIRTMNRTDLAKKAGLAKGTVSKILNGDTVDSSPTTLEAIARALGTTLGFLRMETTNPYKEGEEFPLYGLEMIESLKQLDEVHQFELLLIARSFVYSARELSKINLRHAIAQVKQVQDEQDPESTDKLIVFLTQLQTTMKTSRLLSSKASEE